MKMMIIGSDKIYAIENFYVRYLRELDVTIKHFSAQSLFYDYYQKNISRKLIYKSGLSNIIQSINNKFKEEVEEFQPEVIWVFKGMEIFSSSLKWAKHKGIKLVNYNPDSPFIFSGKGSGNKNVTESIRYYDLFLTYNPEDKIIMEKEYQIRSAILPFGFNIDKDLYDKCAAEEEKLKLCFLGNPDKFRANFLCELAEEGMVMDVFGNDWADFVDHPNISVYEPVYEEAFWKILRKYRVQLNLMRPHNPASHNMRTFEAAGIGAIQLAPETEDHKNYFEPGKEIFLYTDAASCFAQAKKLLALEKKEATLLRNNARARSIYSSYSYRDRAAEALKIIGMFDA